MGDIIMDESGIIRQYIVRKKSPPLLSENYNGVFIKALVPPLDVSRLIGSDENRKIYETTRNQNTLSVEWHYRKSQKTSREHKKNTGILQILYNNNSIASFEVKKGIAKQLLIYKPDLERKIEETTNMGFYQFMKHLYKQSSL